MAEPNKEDLSKMDNEVLKYFAPMWIGEPYREELLRRKNLQQNKGNSYDQRN